MFLAFAKENNIPVEASVDKPYSSDENLMHRSYEAGMLEDPFQAPPEDIFRLTRSLENAADEPDEIEIGACLLDRALSRLEAFG